MWLQALPNLESAKNGFVNFHQLALPGVGFEHEVEHLLPPHDLQAVIHMSITELHLE